MEVKGSEKERIRFPCQPRARKKMVLSLRKKNVKIPFLRNKAELKMLLL